MGDYDAASAASQRPPDQDSLSAGVPSQVPASPQDSPRARTNTAFQRTVSSAGLHRGAPDGGSTVSSSSFLRPPVRPRPAGGVFSSVPLGWAAGVKQSSPTASIRREDLQQMAMHSAPPSPGTSQRPQPQQRARAASIVDLAAKYRSRTRSDADIVKEQQGEMQRRLSRVQPDIGSIEVTRRAGPSLHKAKIPGLEFDKNGNLLRIKNDFNPSKLTEPQFQQLVALVAESGKESIKLLEEKVSEGQQPTKISETDRQGYMAIDRGISLYSQLLNSCSSMPYHQKSQVLSQTLQFLGDNEGVLLRYGTKRGGEVTVIFGASTVADPNAFEALTSKIGKISKEIEEGNPVHALTKKIELCTKKEEIKSLLLEVETLLRLDRLQTDDHKKLWEAVKKSKCAGQVLKDDAALNHRLQYAYSLCDRKPVVLFDPEGRLTLIKDTIVPRKLSDAQFKELMTIVRLEADKLESQAIQWEQGADVDIAAIESSVRILKSFIDQAKIGSSLEQQHQIMELTCNLVSKHENFFRAYGTSPQPTFSGKQMKNDNSKVQNAYEYFFGNLLIMDRYTSFLTQVRETQDLSGFLEMAKRDDLGPVEAAVLAPRIQKHMSSETVNNAQVTSAKAALTKLEKIIATDITNASKSVDLLEFGALALVSPVKVDPDDAKQVDDLRRGWQERPETKPNELDCRTEEVKKLTEIKKDKWMAELGRDIEKLETIIAAIEQDPKNKKLVEDLKKNLEDLKEAKEKVVSEWGTSIEKIKVRQVEKKAEFESIERGFSLEKIESKELRESVMDLCTKTTALLDRIIISKEVSDETRGNAEAIKQSSRFSGDPKTVGALVVGMPQLMLRPLVVENFLMPLGQRALEGGSLQGLVQRLRATASAIPTLSRYTQLSNDLNLGVIASIVGSDQKIPFSDTAAMYYVNLVKENASNGPLLYSVGGSLGRTECTSVAPEQLKKTMTGEEIAGRGGQVSGAKSHIAFVQQNRDKAVIHWGPFQGRFTMEPLKPEYNPSYDLHQVTQLQAMTKPSTASE